MKTIAITIAAIAVIVFVGGGAVTALGWVAVSTYALISGITGSAASVLGLATFVGPRLTATDLKKVESELILNLGEATKAIKDSEKALAKNKEQITKLERDRIELELLVRLTSLQIFQEERLKNIANELDDKILNDGKLRELVANYLAVKRSVEDLKGQVSKSDSADQIVTIMNEIHSANAGLMSSNRRISDRYRRGSLAYAMARVLDVYARMLGIR